MTTPFQAVALWLPEFQNHQKRDPGQKYTHYPELPEEMEDCAHIGAVTHHH